MYQLATVAHAENIFGEAVRNMIDIVRVARPHLWQTGQQVPPAGNCFELIDMAESLYRAADPMTSRLMNQILPAFWDDSARVRPFLRIGSKSTSGDVIRMLRNVSNSSALRRIVLKQMLYNMLVTVRAHLPTSWTDPLPPMPWTAMGIFDLVEQAYNTADTKGKAMLEFTLIDVAFQLEGMP